MIPPRQCGECQACCTAIAVQELRKPFQARCEHQCDTGCAIYGQHPESCRNYICGWRMGMGDEADRPDKIGAVIHHESDEEGVWVQVHATRVLTKIEFAKLILIAEYMMQVAELRGVKLVRHEQAQNCSFEPDTVKYPGYENVPGGTVWKTYDGIHYLLDAPKRTSLKVVS